jgi:hypothetical protein
MLYSTQSGVKLYKLVPADLVAKPFQLRHLDGKVLMDVQANGEWTIQRLNDLLNNQNTCYLVSEAFGADAYIGTRCIGSTEA